jgi:hypothetical protein
MAEKVDDSEPFCLVGYSFGGIMVQEINRLKPAEKVVILGSIKSDKEKSRFIKTGEVTKIPRILPVGLFNEKQPMYMLYQKAFDPKNPNFFNILGKDPYYLKWSVEKVSEWKFEENLT